MADHLKKKTKSLFEFFKEGFQRTEVRAGASKKVRARVKRIRKKKGAPRFIKGLGG